MSRISDHVIALEASGDIFFCERQSAYTKRVCAGCVCQLFIEIRQEKCHEKAATELRSDRNRD